MGFMQGVLSGIGVLAVGTAFVYSASANGVTLNLATPGAVVQLSAPTALPTPTTEPEVHVDPEETVRPGRTLAIETPEPSTSPLLPRIDRGYFDQIAADLSLLAVSLRRIQPLFAEPKPVDREWQNEVGQISELVARGYSNLALIQPPGAAADLHDRLLSATGRCVGVLDAIGADASRVPADIFPLLGETMESCTADVIEILHTVNRSQ